MRLVRIAVLAGGGAVALALAIGCGDEVSKPVVRPAGPGAGSAARVGGAVPGESAKARFHRVNRLDWVGVAHNAMLVELETRLSHGRVHGDVCGEILDVVEGGRYLPPTVHLSRAELRALASRVTASNGMCPSRAAVMRPAAFAQSTDNLSPEATTLVSDVHAAASAAPSSADLAAALLPILDRASQLAPMEAEIVMAGASVAQSSMEHWEATLTDVFVASQTEGILSSYGTCFSNYGTASDGVSACMGLRSSALVEPTTHRRDGRGEVVLRVASYGGCPRTNRTEVVHQDVAGAFGGALMTAWTGGGILAGALGGAAAASSGEMVWQLGSIAWCYGSAAIKGTPIQQT